MEKLFVLKNCLDSKFTWLKKLLVLKNCLDSKIDWMEKLLVLKTTWIQNLIGWEKTACIEKLLG